eukprot:Skav211869  [mRNA]  locus=scaffold1431:174955:175794:- [translate_table: standard]
MTPLHYCANKGHIAVVKQLLAAKANVDAATDLGQTALHSAAATGQVLVIEALLAAGALPDAKDKDGSSLKMSQESFPRPIPSFWHLHEQLTRRQRMQFVEIVEAAFEAVEWSWMIFCVASNCEVKRLATLPWCRAISKLQK